MVGEYQLVTELKVTLEFLSSGRSLVGAFLEYVLLDEGLLHFLVHLLDCLST
mgnify:FL=1